VVAVVARVIRALAEIVQDRMARPLLHLTGNQDPLIQPTVVAVVAVVVDSMAAPGVGAMAAHTAAGRALAILVVKQEIQAPVGVSAIQMDLHPMGEPQVGNRVSLFQIM
jgi:hypothetical protein